MFGAVPYLKRDLGLSDERANDVTYHYVMGNFELESRTIEEIRDLNTKLV